MLESPFIVSLLIISALTTVIGVYGAIYGFAIIIRWDPHSPTESQLRREKTTYLISTILGHIMVIKLFCFFLFIAIAERIKVYLTGAMCAAGSLNSNPFGYRALFLIFLSFLLSCLWLLLNHLDYRVHDFPLIRIKYIFLLFITPFFLIEFCYLFSYFASLDPKIITSCCGSIFDNSKEGLASDLIHLPHKIASPIFWLALSTTFCCGVSIYRSGRFRFFYPFLSVLMLPVSLISIISFISLYIYQLPTHHCPFCLLQSEYGYIGYLLYGSVLLGSVFGMGTGVVFYFEKVPSLRDISVPLRQRLCAISLYGWMFFGILVGRLVFFSDFRLS